LLKKQDLIDPIRYQLHSTPTLADGVVGCGTALPLTKEPIMNEDQAKKLQQLIARAWADNAFKQKLLADPMATLAAEGLPAPAGLTLKAVENTDKVFYLVIPARPTDLSDSDLESAGGLSSACGACTPCSL
jgi:hypothetical protein